jgi:hypothetical protein
VKEGPTREPNGRGFYRARSVPQNFIENMWQASVH